MRYVIGIDAGGTKTAGLLADEQGNVIREARAGGANLLVHGELGVEKEIYRVLEALGDPKSIAALCLGIAGASGESEAELIRNLLRRLGLRCPVRIVHDAYVALVAGASNGFGIVVVAGTGSIAYGVDPTGKNARSGGWGYLLGDEGSAFWLGHAAIRQGIRAADGRGPATSLYDRICSRLEKQNASDLVSWFYDQEESRTRVAQLARVVQEAANDGDEAARDLLDQAAHYLSLAAQAVDRQLDFPGSYSMVLSGGVFKACPSLVHRIENEIALPRAEVRLLDVEPANGAVHLALELLEHGEENQSAGSTRSTSSTGLVESSAAVSLAPSSIAEKATIGLDVRDPEGSPSVEASEKE